MDINDVEAPIPVKAVTVDENVATVELFSEFIDGVTYKVTYGKETEEFVEESEAEETEEFVEESEAEETEESEVTEESEEETSENEEADGNPVTGVLVSFGGVIISLAALVITKKKQ